MNTKSEEKKVYILSQKVKACFWWFFIWAILNFSFLFWRSDWWIGIRIMANYFLWPLLWYIIWGHFIEDHDNHPQKDTKKIWLFIKKVLIYFCLIIIILATFLLAGLHINYEHDKWYCKDEITIGNYFSCINEANNNILNIQRIFKND